jgi:hypothetical protein
MSMHIAVSHYSEKIYICNNKDTSNINEIVSFDPRTYDKILTLYLTKKKKIYDVNEAKENYEKTKNLKDDYKDIFCVNCQIYVPLGYGCKYCSCAYCHSCYNLYELKNGENCPICRYYN